MDFDAVNNMFVAHACWYRNKIVHYYKFRMYTPSTYPNTIEDATSMVPIQQVMMMTTTGDFDGVRGKPIIQFHHDDGEQYSDFQRVVFVSVDDDYMADTYKSVGDVMASGATLNETEIILNLPVVPTNSTLQDPAKKGTNAAPIDAVEVFYRGVEVSTYVFEVTTQEAADFFAKTRTKDPMAFAYKIPVVAFATSAFVKAIPLWHFNQFSYGVTPGNGGGPNPEGMRNVIDADRGDGDAYSPLWHIYWMTEVPVNYMADHVSSRVGLQMDGFELFVTPMFVNWYVWNIVCWCLTCFVPFLLTFLSVPTLVILAILRTPKGSNRTNSL